MAFNVADRGRCIGFVTLRPPPAHSVLRRFIDAKAHSANGIGRVRCVGNVRGFPFSGMVDDESIGVPLKFGNARASVEMGFAHCLNRDDWMPEIGALNVLGTSQTEWMHMSDRV